MRRRMSRVDDEQADEAHAHLGHLVVVRVEHEGLVLPERELVFRRLPRFDVGLCEAADAVHAVWEVNSVPVDGCRNR